VQKIIACVLFSLLDQFSFAQLSQVLSAVDSLTYSNRVGGNKLDSLDLYFTAYPQTTPGGAVYHVFGNFQSNFTDLFDRFRTPFLIEKPISNKFSALPHLGFMYSFGSKGVQFLHTDYQQQLGKRTSFQFLLQQNSLGEMLRNGDFKNRQIQSSLRYSGKKYLFGFDLWFQHSEIGLNHGLQDSVSANIFDLQFLAVNNNEAFSKTNQIRIGTQHILNFSSDSTRVFGLLYKNNWSISNRVYRDSLDLNTKYAELNFDSLKTRDQFQLAKFQNALGFAYRNKKITLEGFAQASYWDFQNIARHQDTTELSLHVNGIYQTAKWQLKNESYLNLKGALGEWSEKLYFRLNRTAWDVKLVAGIENKLPDVFQRKYFANSYHWALTDLKNQQKTFVDLNLSFKNKFEPNVSVFYKQYQHLYFYVGNSWRNDTLTKISLLQFQGSVLLPFKSFGLRLVASVNPLAQNFTYIPLWDLRGRLFFQKKLFKAKKFDFICAVDLKYQSVAQLLDYNAALGLYALNSSPVVSFKSDWVKIDFYTAFKIDEFRFYFKLENIDYSWLNRDIKVLSNYPIAPRMIRLGVTWDFFN